MFTHNTQICPQSSVFIAFSDLRRESFELCLWQSQEPPTSDHCEAKDAKICLILSSLWALAKSAAVRPRAFFARSSALACSSCSTTAAWPLATALWSGVMPHWSVALTSAPCRSKSFANKLLPFRATWCSAVNPSRSAIRTCSGSCCKCWMTASCFPASAACTMLCPPINGFAVWASSPCRAMTPGRVERPPHRWQSQLDPECKHRRKSDQREREGTIKTGLLLILLVIRLA